MFTPRIGWHDLPQAERDRIEASLGSAVVDVRGCVGGFSPGTADVVTLADGRRVFVKAVHETLNDHTPTLHRRELGILRRLPADLPVPRLLDGWDDDWVVLLIEAVDGASPTLPWSADTAAATLAAFDALAERGTPCPVPDLPAASEVVGQDLTHWPGVAPERLGRWQGLAETLDARARAASEHIGGDTLCVVDARSDNLVVDRAGKVWIVDWPWAEQGAAWLDRALVGMDMVINPGPGMELDGLLTRLADVVDPDVLLGFWGGYAGYFLWACDKPAPPGLPTIRTWQRRNGERLLDAVAPRLTAGA